MEGPFLWYLNRGTGVVVLVLLTITTVLGVVALGNRSGRGLPRFVSQALHRNLALLSVALLVAHVVSAVVDEYVEIRWWQSFVPFAGELRAPVARAGRDRARPDRRRGRDQHAAPPDAAPRLAARCTCSSYGLWLMSLLHGLGMGTDLGGAWWLVAVACAAAVPLAATYRLGLLLLDRPEPDRRPSDHRGSHPMTTYLDPHLIVRTDADDRPASPVPIPTRVTVHPGPALLAGIEHGPSLAAHRRQYGDLPRLDRDALHDLVQRVRLRGRGGAGVPVRDQARGAPPRAARCSW